MYATLTVPVVILEESFLAFIGLPVQYQGIIRSQYHQAVEGKPVILTFGMNRNSQGVKQIYSWT